MVAEYMLMPANPARAVPHGKQKFPLNTPLPLHCLSLASSSKEESPGGLGSRILMMEVVARLDRACARIQMRRFRSPI